MIEERMIHNGDMISMAKIVNGNTVTLNNRVSNLKDNLRSLGKCHNNYVKHNDRTVKFLTITSIGLGIALYFQNKEISKLRKQVKKIEDQQVYDNFMREEAENDLK